MSTTNQSKEGLKKILITGASGLLPAYKPSTSFGTAGTLSNVQLSTGAQAPISGAFSPDDSTFFVGTSGGATGQLRRG